MGGVGGIKLIFVKAIERRNFAADIECAFSLSLRSFFGAISVLLKAVFHKTCLFFAICGENSNDAFASV